MTTYTRIIALTLAILFPLAAIHAETESTEATQAEPTKTPEWVYSFRPGDTIWNVCQEYCDVKNCWLKLADYNGIDKDRAIPPGTKIVIPVAWLKQKPLPVTIIQAADALKVSSSGEKTPLSASDKIYLKEGIITQEAFAVVQLANNAKLTISPHTHIVFDTLSVSESGLIVSAKLSLYQGRVQSTVDKQGDQYFDVQTPSAVATVRGTTFNVAYNADAETMITEVDNGEVAVGSTQGETVLPAGYASIAKQGEAPSQAIQRLAAPVITTSDETPVHITGSIAWEAVEGAIGYQIIIADPINTDIIYEQITTSETAFAINDINNSDDPYFQGISVQVTAVDSNQILGIPTDFLLYEIDRAPLLPELTASWQHEEGVIVWHTSSLESGLTYELEYSAHHDFEAIESHLILNKLDSENRFHPQQRKIYARIKASNGVSASYSNVIELVNEYKFTTTDKVLSAIWILMILGI